MPRIDIPGREPLQLTHALFDLNGTLALDGQLLPGILPLFQRVCAQYACLVLTGDTFGTGLSLAQVLGCPVRRIDTGLDKARVVREL
ncbi:HAD family hydrolase, partial [mine drainage metagenome]